MDERFSRQLPLLGEEGQRRLHTARVLILGCGGLGGYLAENMARLGVGHLTLADGDAFSPSNLNRQHFALPETLGKNKAETAAAALRGLCPSIRAVPEYLTEENADTLLAGHDLVLDALDRVDARLWAEDACERSGIPLVHGAVDGWAMQVSAVRPGDRTLHRLYRKAPERETPSPSLVFVVAACAAEQSAEALRLLLGEAPLFAGEIFFRDFQSLDSGFFSPDDV